MIFNTINLSGLKEFVGILLDSGKILGYIISAITIINLIKEAISKPRFFIHKLQFLGQSESDGQKKQYQLEGRLVDTKERTIKSMELELLDGCVWKGNLNCKQYRKNEHDEWNDKPNDIISNSNLNKDEEFKFKAEFSNKTINKNTTYDIVGNYEAELNKSGSRLKVYVNAEDENRKGENKRLKAKVKKCPNIRICWLLSYLVISTIVIYIGVTSMMTCIRNIDYIIMATSELKFVFVLFGLIILFTTVFFVAVFWKCLSGCFVLRRMKKFGVPEKKGKVSDTFLIPRVFQYMTGIETVDNIL